MSVESLGPYTLTLTEDCFPLGEDSLALASFATLRPGWPVCDLGCGGGTLLLLLARRESSLSLTGIERLPGPAETARRNLAQNGLSGRIVTGDLRDRSLLPNEGFSLAVSNPPYFPVGTGRDTASPTRQLARQEAACTLEEVCRAAARLLKTGGRFCLCLPPRRLAEALALLEGAGISPKRLQLVQHRPGRAPFLVLLEGRRGGRPGLEVLSTRMLAGEKEGNG